LPHLLTFVSVILYRLAGRYYICLMPYFYRPKVLYLKGKDEYISLINNPPYIKIDLVIAAPNKKKDASQ